MMKGTKTKASLPKNRTAGSAASKPGIRQAEVTCLARLKIGERFHSGRLCRIAKGMAEVQMQVPLQGSGEVVLMLPNLPPIAGTVHAPRGKRVTVTFCETVRVCQLLEWIGERAKILEPEAA